MNHIPYRWKRCVLLCHVVNSALSAVECFIPSSGQQRKLELAVAGLCRRAMRGKASLGRCAPCSSFVLPAGA
eukprot:2204403-Pyramimonas_sp.AAC.1